VDGNIAINRKVKDNRDGYSLTAHLGAGYEQTIAGGFYVRPQLRFDYFSLNETAYKETDTVGTGFALNVNSRNGSASSGTASVVFGRTWGTDFRVRPEFELGVRDTFSGDAGKTTAKFVSGTTSFTLTPSDISGSGGIARFGLKAATDFYEIGLQAGTEVRSNFYSGDVRATFRLLF
jgi:outer membrane autotransporter protein